MRIGFFPNMGKSTIMAVLKMAAHICREEQIEVYLPDDLERPDTYKVLQIPKENVLPRPEIFKHIDVAFSFGGDGTIIHLARQIFSYNIPVCGINLGELGFLNQIEVHQLQSHIKRIAQGDYTIEKRGHLHAYIDREDGTREDLVPIINEVVITRSEPAKMARINLAVNDILGKANYNNILYHFNSIDWGTRGKNDMRGVELTISYTIFNKEVSVRTSRKNESIIQRTM